MEEKNKNEELQSRREFFKKAAKGALPILAVVALSSAPNIIRAAKITPGDCGLGVGCDHTCKSGCYGTCRGSCQSGCQGSCQNTCSTYCKGSCAGYCTGSSR